MERPEERLKLEERLIPSSSLANEIRDGSGMQESDSSATPAVVLGALVAIRGSFAYGFSNCNWAVTFTFHFMMEWSKTGTFSIFWVICAAGVAFVAFLAPETKGRTLEEIQASITKLSGT
ncbi:hypothetical protein AB3S75_012352 [Citrus x aurantiifolia]